MQPIDPAVRIPYGWTETLYAKDQPEYLPLPTLRSRGSTAHVVSRWRLTWTERLRLLWTGDLWLMLLTFGEPLQPVKLSTTPFNLAAEYNRAHEEWEEAS